MNQQTYNSTGGWLVHRPISTKDRLILPFWGHACCSPGPGLLDDSREVPAELKERGLSEQQWSYFRDKLTNEVQRHSPSVCALIGYWTCAIMGLFCCLWHSEGKYHKLLGGWLDDFNSQVLNNMNLYAKVQSNEVTYSDGKNTHSETISWLAISLNDEDARKLRNEPVVWNPKCCSNTIVPSCCQKVCCCCGPNRFV